MDSLTKTYMLLPRFPFTPDIKVELGYILPFSESSRLPDPENPLNADQFISLDAPPMPQTVVQDFSFEQLKSNTNSAGLWANMSILTGLGGGIEGGKGKSTSIRVRCQSLTIDSFVPSEAYIQQCLKDDFLDQYLRTFPRPSVYLVTGVMTASKVSYSLGHEESRKMSAGVSADATCVGVPINVGPEYATRNDQYENISASRDSIVLAYSLRRITRKITGKIKNQVYNKWALLDDGRESAEKQLNEYDFEDVSPSTTHER